VLFDSADDFGDHTVHGLVGIRQGDDGTERIPVGELQVNATGFKQVGNDLAICPGTRKCEHDFCRVVHKQGR
jgi:hypothetical protein